jgi:Poly(hydroxyalcanoate) granule associated protein (phasin)
MLSAFQQKANRVGDSVFAASRQVWLAGLGAAVVTRAWAEKEASGVFRTLVKEGTVVESRAIRLVGDQVESTVTKANAVLKQTRAAIESVVRIYGDTAMGVLRLSLPRLAPQPAVVAKATKVRATKKSMAPHKSRKSTARKSKSHSTR